MFRTIAYIIFLCTGIFAFSLIVFFFRDLQDIDTPQVNIEGNQIISSGKTLDLIKRTYTFKPSKQKDIFGVTIFRFDVDIRASERIRMYVFQDDYLTMKKNLLLLDTIYSFSEVDEPFGKVFFLNDKSGDDRIVRFITQADGVVLWFEVMKDEYTRLKGLLLQ